jgi:multiple sugar transport system substrate-binding protein
MKPTNWTWKIVTGLLLIAVLAAACQPAATPTSAPAETQAPSGQTGGQPQAAAKYGPIVVAIWSGPEHDNLVKTAAQYESETGNKVTIEEIARESYYDKLSTVLVAGGKDYDVIYVSADWTPGWVAAKALKELNGFINDPNVVSPDFKLDVLQPGVGSVTFDGNIYGFPSEGDTAWLFYRKDLLEANNIAVPQTMDEYLAAAQKLNSPPDHYGTVIGVKLDEASWDFMHYFYAFGASMLDDQYNVTVNDEKGVAALTFYSDLLRKYQVVSPDVTTYGYNEILTALQQGKAAMGVEWMAATADLQNCDVSPAVCKDGQPLLNYTIVPGIKQADGTISHGQGASQWAWVIPAASQNQEAAYKFIEWLTGKTGAKTWALNGGIPSNTIALSDPDVVAKVPQFKLLAEAMPLRHLFPNTTVTPDLVNAFNEAIVAAVAGTKTPQQALDDAAVKMTDSLKKAGYIK